MNTLIGKKYVISGMSIEVISDAGERWEMRNLTSKETVYINKAVLDNAIRLGKAEAVSD